MVGAILFISGCATAPSHQTIANANYGRVVTQTECEEIVTKDIQSFLKDPSSAKYDFGVCHKGWQASPLLLGGGTKFGYILDTDINAKNSFGGYTGAKTYKFIINNGIITGRYRMDEDYGVMLPF